MGTATLEKIDWDSDMYHIDETTVVDLSSDDISDKTELIKMILRSFERSQDANHYVYCFSFQDGDAWYVGETENLYDRLTTHIREKGITNLEHVEPVADRDAGLERERELSYEVAIDKKSTEIYGGK